MKIQERINMKIEEAKELGTRNGMIPTVYLATMQNGKKFVGLNFHRFGVAVGDQASVPHPEDFRDKPEIVWAG
jgi:hypothetical protein